MMAATGLLKKKRTTRIRHPVYSPDPPLPPPPPPADARRSLRPRRRRPLAGDYFDDDYEVDGEDIASDDEEDEDRRRLKLVLKIPPAGRHVVPPDGEYGGSPEIVKPLKKRRIEDCSSSSSDSDGSSHHPEEKKRSMVVRRKFSGTRLPEKAAIFEVLDRLQKKDTYSVFARPVDPEDLPDYHDVIEHQMDFRTVRRKVAGGLYRSFEQFEDARFSFLINFPPGFKIGKYYWIAVWKWQRLPYWSPYEDVSGYDLRSVEARKRTEKRAVAMIHEILSLTVEKRTTMERIAHFRQVMGLSKKLKEFLLQHQGIFYVSTRGDQGKLHTVFLREAYRKGGMVEPNEVYLARRKLRELLLMSPKNANLDRMLSSMGRAAGMRTHEDGSGKDNDDSGVEEEEEEQRGK